MSKSLLDLLNKTRGDIASKRGNNVDLTRLKDGNNYLRIFPNKATRMACSSRLSVCTTLSIRMRKAKM